MLASDCALVHPQDAHVPGTRFMARLLNLRYPLKSALHLRGVFFLALATVLMLPASILQGGTSQNFASAPAEITEDDRRECQLLVEGLLQAWMNGQYEVMHQALSKNGMGKMEKAKFMAVHEDYSARGGKIVKYSIGNMSHKNDRVFVKADVAFQREIPPKIVSGIHTFSLMKDGVSWKIDYMTPPLTAPAATTLPGGSHPGE